MRQRRLGRPHTDPAMHITRRLAVGFTGQDWEALQAEAARQHLPVGALARQWILRSLAETVAKQAHNPANNTPV